MARYNPHKPAYYASLKLALDAISRAALAASRVDQSAVDVAAKALQFAGQWTRDTTDGARKRMAIKTALLNDALEHAPASTVTTALAAFSAALAAFDESEYIQVQRFADLAKRALD